MARRKTAPPAAETKPADLRGAQRFTLILRAGKLVTAGGEYLCVLRDVSAGGMKVKLFHPLKLEGPCRIELAQGDGYDLEPAWQDGVQAGLRFAEGPVDVAQLLDEAGPFPKRAIRLHLARPLAITLHSEQTVILAQLRDISQHGAAIHCESRLAIGQSAELVSAALGSVAARVRWRRGNTYGLVFQQSFRLDDLARLVAVLQQQAGAPPSKAGLAATR